VTVALNGGIDRNPGVYNGIINVSSIFFNNNWVDFCGIPAYICQYAWPILWWRKGKDSGLFVPLEMIQ
jgi:hypothetical protein